MLGKGKITSNGDLVDIVFGPNITSSAGNFEINSIIADNVKRRIGVRISSIDRRFKGLTFGGDYANTFTGELHISNGVNVVLKKREGVLSVRGNVLVDTDAKLVFDTSYQISSSSVVRLRSGKLSFGSWGSDVTNSFSRLVVEKSGVLGFGHQDSPNSIKKLFLDDLFITDGSLLKVEGWKEGRDFIFVRKDSKNLNDALAKMKFEGYDPGQIHLENFNNEYWQIIGAPEPSTCGAILGTLGLGLAFWRKHRKGR